MSKVKLVGNTLIAEMNGNFYTNNTLSKEEQIEILMLISNFPVPSSDDEALEQEILVSEKMKFDTYETPKEKEASIKIKKKVEKAIDTIGTLQNGLDEELFELRNDSLYFKKIPLSIPLVLAERISKATGTEKTSLINFWYRCAKNENPQSRHDLFEFISRYNFQVLSSGLFVAYRNVVLKSQYKDKFEYYLELYNKIKAWKRSLSYYDVISYSDGVNSGFDYIDNSKPNYEGRLAKKFKELQELKCKPVVLGTFNKLWENLIYKENIFTDNHTKTFNISIKKLVEMPRTSCDKNPYADCSYGLHVGTPDFLNKGTFGDVCIAVLVDPEDVICVPTGYTNKMRICKYYPVDFTSYDDRGKLIELNLKEEELEYVAVKIDEIKDIVDSKANFDEYKLNKLIPQELEFDVYYKMGVYLEEASKVVNKRKIKLNK